MKIQLKLLAATAFAVIMVQQNSAFAQTPPVLVATYQSIHDNIFVPKCMTCHAVGKKAEDVPLEPYSALLAQTDVVSPGNSGDSSLYLKTLNGKMPTRNSGIAPLTSDEETTLKAWIDAGASGP